MYTVLLQGIKMGILQETKEDYLKYISGMIRKESLVFIPTLAGAKDWQWPFY
jgi:hypothetical protein